MIDTHCHLTHRRFGDEVADVVGRAREAGLQRCVTIGTGVEDARAALALSRGSAGFIDCTAGIDPFTSHAAGERFDDELAELADLLASGDFVALGEVGLDYHYDLDPRPVQVERFERQLDLAARLDLPVVIHVREAHADMAAILRTHSRNRGVVHSFTAGPAQAEAYLDAGWSLGLNGVLTFRNAEPLREAAARIPAERLLLETDSPYLAPVPHRGGRCEPAHVVHTLARLAYVRGESVVALADTTTANALRLFARGATRRS